MAGQPTQAAQQMAEFSSNIPATDLSKQLMDSLFGPGWNSIGGGGIVDPGTSASLLFDILGAINVLAMSIAALLLVGYTMYGIIGTAHEGKPLGQKMHSIWAPVRSAVAVSFLAPVFQGMCVLQLICLVCIGGSVHFANQKWSTGLDYMGKNSGHISTVFPTNVESHFQTVATDALKTLAIQQYLMQYEEKKLPGGKITTWEEWVKDINPIDKDGSTGELSFANEKGYWMLTFHAPQVVNGGILSWGAAKLKDGDLGRLVIPARSKTDKIGLARKAACDKAIGELSIIARDVIFAKRQGKKVTTTGDEFKAVVLNYVKAVKPALMSANDINEPEYEKNLEAFVKDAKEWGWFMAGSYYWTLSRYAERQAQVFEDKPDWNEYNKGAIYKAIDIQASAVLKSFDAISGKRAFEDKLQLARSGRDSDGKTDVLTTVINFLSNKIADNLTNWTVNKMSGEGDIVGNLCSLGHYVIALAYTIPAFQIGSSIAAGAADGVAQGVVASFATGGIAGGITGGIISGIAATGPYLIALFVPFLMLGISLAFYLPSLPFIAWSSAVVGWLLLCLETLFAAPLWAVAHAIPEGEGIAGQHGRQGYMLLLAVLVRAPLMVAGFFCALIVTSVIGKFLGVSFMVFNAGLNGDHVSGPATVISMVFIFGMTCIVLVHRVFKLITHLPDTVTKWVGQQVQNLGEDGDEQRTRQAFSSGGQSVAQGISGGMGASAKKAAGGDDGKGGKGGTTSGKTDSSDHEMGQASGKSGDGERTQGDL